MNISGELTRPETRRGATAPGKSGQEGIIFLPPEKIAKVLSVIVILLTLASLGVGLSEYVWHYYLKGLAHDFYLDEKQNIPTWYKTSTLLVCSLLLAVAAKRNRAAGDRFAAHWSGLSFFFMVLSVDELIALHDRANGPVRAFFHVNGWLHHAWIIPGAVIVLILGLAYLPFLLHLPPRTRRLVFLAGALYVGGGLGVDMVTGHHVFLYGARNLTYALMATFKEFLQMMGTVVFIYALLLYLRDSGEDLELRIADRPPASS